MVKRKILLLAIVILWCSQSVFAEETQRYTQELSEYLHIDAVVQDPGVDELPILSCAYIDYAEYDFADFSFFPEGLSADMIEEHRVDEGTEWEHTVCTAKQNAYLEELRYTSDGYFNFSTPMGHLVFSAILYATHDAEIPFNQDLHFMTCEAAENAAKEFLATLGMSQSAVNGIQTISKDVYDALYEFGREWHEADLSEGLTKLGATEWYDWPTQDVCYVLNCSPAYQGVPFVAQNALQTSSSSMENLMDAQGYWPSIELYWFAEGVEYLDIANAVCYQAVGEAAKILSFEEAVERFVNGGPRLLSLQQQTVTEIGLYYIIRPEAEGYIARPYWVFVAEREQREPLHAVKSYLFLDAHSGEWSGEWR